MKRLLLGDIAAVSSGGTPDRSNRSFWGGEIPWIKTGEVQFGIIRSAGERITQSALDQSSAKLVRAGSLLMAMYGQGKTRGQVALLGIDAAINQACAAISPFDNDDSEYLFQYLAANYQNVRRLSNSGSQENLNAKLIRGIPIFYPPKNERVKIADILGTWDDALERLDALIITKDRQKQALMQRLLSGRKRPPDFHSDWPIVQLGEVAENVADVNKGRMTGDLLYGVNKARGIVPMRDHVKGENHSRCKHVNPGDFAYNPMRINIGSIARWHGTKTIMVSGDYVVFRCDEQRLLPAYLDHLRASARWRYFMKVSGNGSVRVRIYFRDLADFAFPCPPIEEQRAVAATLDTADVELHLLRRQRIALDHQKRGLMQRLLTGKVRVETL